MLQSKHTNHQAVYLLRKIDVKNIGSQRPCVIFVVYYR